jgi:hypothetical protein
MNALLRRVRGAAGNALAWGLSWFAGGIAVLGTLRATGLLPVSWSWVLYVSSNLGATGFLTGVAFSIYLPLAYRSKQVADIRVGRFSLQGAAVSALLVPAVTWLARATVGLGVPIGDLVSFGLTGAVVGGVTSAVTLKVAQHGHRRLAKTALLELEEEQAGVPALLAVRDTTGS